MQGLGESKIEEMTTFSAAEDRGQQIPQDSQVFLGPSDDSLKIKVICSLTSQLTFQKQICRRILTQAKETGR